MPVSFPFPLALTIPALASPSPCSDSGSSGSCRDRVIMSPSGPWALNRLSSHNEDGVAQWPCGATQLTQQGEGASQSLPSSILQMAKSDHRIFVYVINKPVCCLTRKTFDAFHLPIHWKQLALGTQ